MNDYHQTLIGQYNEIRSLQKKLRKKAVIFEVLIMVIVCSMKLIQASANVTLNLIASLIAGSILILHFWDFKYRTGLERKIVDVVGEGIEIEQNQPFSKSSFFRGYLKEFNFFSEIAEYLIFDFFILFFFSVSITQLIKSINSEIVMKIAPSTPLRTMLINGVLFWSYYVPFKPIINLKKGQEGSLI